MNYKDYIRKSIAANKNNFQSDGCFSQNKKEDINKTELYDGHTCLLWAVRNGSSSSLESLLKFGLDINLKGSTGVTPLILATYLGNLWIVNSLVTYDENSLEYDDVCGNSPLAIAAREGHLNIVEFLIESGADVKKPNIKKETPLILAIKAHHLKIVELLLDTTNERYVMVVAVRSGSVTMVQCLIDKKVDLNETNNEKTPLAWAAAEGYLEIAKVLLANRANINLCSPDGNTPLATAVRYRQTEIAEYLINMGANVCKKEMFGRTPLSWAVHNEDLEMVKLLLENGAEYIVDSVFLQAIETNNLKIVQLLKDGGALINMTHSVEEKKITPLAKSLEVRSIEIAKYLVENGAIETEAERIMALSWAIKNENIDMIKFLLDHGAKSAVDSVFLQAIETRNLEIVQLLKKAGAHVTITQESKDNKGTERTPLMKSLDVGSIEISKYLIENGAKVVDQLGEDEISFIIRFMENSNFEMVKRLTENGARLDVFGDCGHTVLTKSVQMENFEMVKYFVERGAGVNKANENQDTPLAVAASVNEFQIFQYLIDSGATINEDLAEGDESQVTLLRYYKKAKENRLRREKQKSEFGSGQESAKDD